jgi:outer membrane protein OmpA-like peptidoglycan-associated protein
MFTSLKASGYFLGVVVAVALSGCVSTPKAVPTIEEARADIRRAETRPLAGEAAAREIEAAHAALREAESLAEKRASAQRVANAAYLAKRHAQIAEQQIAEAQAKKDLETAELERQQALLQARQREAQENAREAELRTRQAEQLAQEAARKEQQVAAANQEIADLQKQLADLNAKQTERGLVLTLGDVLFDTGKATLKPGAIPSIDRLAAFLRQSEDRVVQIEGHTDNVGSDEFNQSLSQQRADAVREALVGRGIEAGRINATGKGEGFPVASNDSAGGRQQNRRVEIILDADLLQSRSPEPNKVLR